MLIKQQKATMPDFASHSWANFPNPLYCVTTCLLNYDKGGKAISLIIAFKIFSIIQEFF